MRSNPPYKTARRYGGIIKGLLLSAVVIAFILWLAQAHQEEMIGQAALKVLANELKAQKQQEELDHRIKLFASADESLSLPPDAVVMADASALMDMAEFTSYSLVNNRKARVRFPVHMAFDPAGIVIFKFAAYAQERCGMLEISFNNGKYSYTYPVSTQPTEYYVPLGEGFSSIDELTITLTSEFDQLHVGDLSIVNYRDDYQIQELKTGMFNISGARQIREIGKEALVSGSPAVSCLGKGGYLYAVGSNGLLVYEKGADGSLLPCGSLKGLGSVRDMAFCGDGALVVTSRENGAYFLDITDPTAPSVLSHYDTLELVSGVDVCGDYAFLCSRYFGTEIVDISDIVHPRRVSAVRALDEQMDCVAADGYLYVSAWAQKKIDIYDVKTVDQPVKISEILLDGNGSGLFVEKGILYAATGYSARSMNAHVNDPGYGQGNGLEIYDVSDPYKPQWLSTAKVDGRYVYSGYDIWKVYVNHGRAYLTSAFNGVYVYDVANPADPVGLEKWVSKIGKAEENYFQVTASGNWRELNDREKRFIFGYDTSEYIIDPIMGLAFDDGVAYMCSELTGISKTASDAIAAEEPDGREYAPAVSAQPRAAPNLPAELDARQYRTAYNCYAADVKDRYIYVAAGSGGIDILDDQMNFLVNYEAAGAVKDIVLRGDYMYTAESEAGVGIYKVYGTDVVKISQFNIPYEKRTFSSLELSADGKHLVAQAGWTYLAVVDVTDPKNPAKMEYDFSLSPGTMYYRNLCTGLVDGQYIVVGGRTYTCVFGPGESGFDRLKNDANHYYSEHTGSAACGKNLVQITSNGYVYYDPLSYSGESLPLIKAEGARLKGKASIDGSLMVVTCAYEGRVQIVDISDLDHPSLLMEFVIEGYPDIAYIGNGFILIPAKDQGLIKIAVPDAPAPALTT